MRGLIGEEEVLFGDALAAAETDDAELVHCQEAWAAGFRAIFFKADALVVVGSGLAFGEVGYFIKHMVIF